MTGRKISLLKNLRGNAGFTLLEVLAVVALLGILGAMLMPSLDSAADRAKNAKLQSDLATIDNAIVLYKMDNGSYPDSLEVLSDEYIAAGKEFTDALGDDLSYTSTGITYKLTGKNANGETVTSDGSSAISE